MHINAPDYETSFVVPFKSGTHVFYSTLIEVFQLNDIKYYLSNDTKDMLTNSYLFVRNPLDRFFSGYKWFYKNQENYKTNKLVDNEMIDYKNLIEIFEQLEIFSLKDYIKKYTTFINVCSDLHYLPQTSFFLKRNEDKGIRANLNFNFRKEYEERFIEQNYKFFRMEDIDNLIKINHEHLMSIKFNFPYYENITLKNINFKKFTFLKKFPDVVHYQFMLLYTYFMSYYNDFHHVKVDNFNYMITYDDYISTQQMLFKEMIFLGYDEKDIKLGRKDFEKFV